MEVSNGTAAGKAEAARKSADTTGAATASADRKSHRGRFRYPLWSAPPPIVADLAS